MLWRTAIWSSSIWPCRAAARTAPSPGACSTGCSRSRGFAIDGISGTSAGAMNAAVLVDGYAKGGADGARAALETFWRRVSDAARFSPFQRDAARRAARPLDARLLAGLRRHGSHVAPVLALRPQSRRAPIRCATSWPRRIDFDRLAHAPIKLFVTATNVRTGRGRVFRNAEITPDVLLASACLPTMFQAVEIDGERLLGRRLFRQSDDHAAGARMRPRTTRSWFRSIRSSGRARRAPRARSSTG